MCVSLSGARRRFAQRLFAVGALPIGDLCEVALPEDNFARRRFARAALSARLVF